MKIKFLSLLKNVRFIVFMIFVISIFIMSYGFATLKSDMRIFGLATVTKYGKVYISAVEELSHEFVNASGEDPDFNDTVATMQVNAEDVIFSATYKITITNSMNIDQVLTGVTLNTTVLSGSGTVDSYVQMTDYSTGSAFYPGDILPARSDTVLKVKIYYTADSKVTVETEFGIMAGDESTGSLSKGTISRNTGSFDDNKTPECYTVDFMNSYDFENVIGITTSSGYEILNTSGGVLGNVRVPANSTKTVTYCIRPTGIMTNSSTNLPISYKSYSTGQTFSDTIVISMTTNRRTLIVTTNFDDGIIICNNLTKGYYGIIGSIKTGSVDVYVGDEIECSVGDGNARSSNNNYYYYSNNTYNSFYYNKWTITNETSSYNKFVPLTGYPTIISFDDSVNSGDLHTIATNGTYTASEAGYYMIELWGGIGGDGYNVSKGYGGYGGDYGYVYGAVYLNKNQTLSYSLGGDGTKGVYEDGSVAGGANGGGSTDSDRHGNGGTGSGYSSVTIGGTLYYLAGGGGGAAGGGGIVGTDRGGDGGAAGKLNSYESSELITLSGTGIIIKGKAGQQADGSSGSFFGLPGSNTGGTNAKCNECYGSSMTGGRAKLHGGGGGSGYFGGAGGTQGRPNGKTYELGTYSAGGGGGSSFLYKDVIYSGLPSYVTSIMALTRSTDISGGVVRITLVGNSLS